MKKTSYFLLRLLPVAALFLAGLAGAQEEPAAWDLDRCLAEARLASPGLAADRAQVEAAAAGLTAARAERYPVLNLSGDYRHVTETMKMTLPLMPPRTLEFGNGNTTDLMLGLQVPLYQGGALPARRQAARARLQAERFTVQADSLDLGLQVRRTFFSALGAEAAMQAARRGEERLQRHLQDTERNQQAGMASEEAVVLSRVRLVRQQQATILAAAEATRLRLALGRLVGRAGQEISPAAPLQESVITDDPATVPWDNRPTLQALDSRLDAGASDVRAAAGSLRPSVDLQGGWHYGKPGIDTIANDWMDYGSVAVGVRWTLFDFGRRDGRLGSLRAGNRALEHRREDTLRGLRTRLQTARVQREAAGRTVEQSVQRVELQQKYLELVSSRLREGFATQREYLDAQDDLTLAEMDLAVARANLRGAEAELLAALGH